MKVPAAAMMALFLALAHPWCDPLVRPALVWPAAPAEARVKFVRAFSAPQQLGLEKGVGAFFRRLLFGEESAGLVRPYGVAVSADGKRIFVADPGLKAVAVFDTKSRKFSLLHEAGGQPLESPVGVAVGGDGTLFVSDSSRGIVAAFDSKLRYQWSLGAGEGLQRPTGVAVRGDTLYVVDTAANRVVSYRTGVRPAQPASGFGSRGAEPGRFNYPVDIAVSGTDRIYVNDSMNFRVQALNGQGAAVGSVGGAGDSSGHFQRPKGVAVDSGGNLYVVDALSDVVQIFDPAARFLLSFGSPGAGDGEFWLPSGIAIDASDRIYVADTWNHRIQVFEVIKEARDASR